MIATVTPRRRCRRRSWPGRARPGAATGGGPLAVPRRTARSRPAGASSLTATPRARPDRRRWLARRSARRATTSRISASRSSSPGSARRRRATRSTIAHRRPFVVAVEVGGRQPTISSTRAAARPAAGQGGQARPEQGRRVALDPRGPDRDRRLPGEDAGQLDVAQAERGRRALVEHLEDADRAAVRRAAGTATIERGT